MFNGVHNISLDSKGRMSIPAKHRDALTQLVIVPNPDPTEPCLWIYPQSEWEEVSATITALPNTKVNREIKRKLIGRAVEYVVDTNGRVLLTADLRNAANLQKKLALVGQGNKCELWDEDSWQAICGGLGDVSSEAFNEALETLTL